MIRIFLVLFIALSLFLKAEEDKKNISNNFYSDRYFPLNIEKILIYSSNFGETEFSIKKVDNEFLINNTSDDFNYNQKIVKQKGEVFITMTEQEVDVFLFLSSHTKVTYNQPALRYPFPMEDGKTWKWNGKEFFDDDSSNIVITGEVLGSEKITVPAGEFECLKIRTKIGSVDDEKKDIVTEWLAEDIGLVKIEADVGKGGIVGLIQDLFGLEILNFELKEIRDKK